MSLIEILSSIERLESTILLHAVKNIEDINQLVRDEIPKIQSSTSDQMILNLISGINFNWKIFSGQKYSEGYESFRQREMDLIISDCKNLKQYLNVLVNQKVYQ